MAFLTWIEGNLTALLARDPAALAYAVRRCCEIKAWVVGEDEREAGLRAILNFGHTFGHAIEAALGYGQWLHGEGVACGMALASDLSVQLGLLRRIRPKDWRRSCCAPGLPVQAPFIEMDRWFELMRVDKKAEMATSASCSSNGPGKAVVRAAPDALVRQVIQRRTTTQRLVA
jgi:3-dehydroquinate synthase